MYRHGFTMTGTAFIEAGRRFPGPLVSAVLLVFLVAGHSEESYLDAISVEAKKLQNGPAGVSASEGHATDVAEDPLAKFEQELEARYRGSYLFYKKLPAKSREEVFLEHRQGASIEDVRKTILNRYLHSR